MSERMDGWRYCADPVELAAAVAAGVEVLCVAVDGRTWETGCEDSESFRRCMANGCRYRVPPSWSWSYEPPTTVTGDDLPERRVWTCKIGGRVGRLSGCADAPMRRAVADAFTAETGYPVEFCFSGWGDDLDESELAVVEDRAPDPEAIRAALVKRLTAIPPPEPPAQGHGGGPCCPPGHHDEGERTMTGYVTPTTWEQCARHVEAGGIVEVQTAWGAWEREYLTPRTYRRRHGAPGGSAWVTRRLEPIESAARTGAERYLTDRMTDPEYAEAHLEATRHLTATVVPDGYEVVVLPVETVDEFDAGEDDRVSRGHVVAGAREAQARRGTTPAPPPAPSPVPPWPGDENDDTARLSPDQGDRIVNACCRMLGCEPADIDGDAALEEILTEAVERCADLHGQDRWEDDCHGCGFRVGDHTTDGRCPAPDGTVEVLREDGDA